MSRDPCTACDEEFEEEDLLLVCSVCLVEHHAACYIANGIKCHACGSSATPIDLGALLALDVILVRDDAVNARSVVVDAVRFE